MKKTITILLIATLFSCNKNKEKADGYGNFEATEITIASEANGKIEFLKVEENGKGRGRGKDIDVAKGKGEESVW